MENKQFAKKAISIVLIVALVASVFVGYLYLFGGENRLDTPLVSINTTNKTISWNAVNGAEHYEIYANNDLEETIPADENKTAYVYSIEELLTQNIVYRFTIAAKSSRVKESFISNAVAYINFEVIETSLNEYNISNTNSLVSGLAVTGTVLEWNSIPNVDKYYMAMVTNDGQYIKELNSHAFDFTDIAEGNSIIMFRVGHKNENDVILLSNPVYYTAVQESAYSSNIFYFKNKFFSHYINSQEELNQLTHYIFVNRIAGYVDVKISNTFYNEVLGRHGNSPRFEYFKQALNTASSSFLETSAFETEFTATNWNDAACKTFRIRITHRYGTTPTKTNEKTFTQNNKAIPQYLQPGFVARGEDYNIFASDNKLVPINVSSSEQLYWAVESGAMPIPQAGSTAETLYNKAKEVLNRILSNDMSQYEKVRNIFDYITYETVYDHIIVDDNSIIDSPRYKSFYLEGVLTDGLAVCDGFAKTFSLLCNMEGIDAVRIVGNVSSGAHAWNKVKLGNHWYVADNTWTEMSVGSTFLGISNEEYLSHAYFLVSDAQLASAGYRAYNSAVNASMPAPQPYNYFSQESYEFEEQTRDFFIADTNELKDLIKYIYTENVASVQILVPSDYFASAAFTQERFGQAVTQARTSLGINKQIYTLGGVGNGRRCYYTQTKYGYVFILQMIF